MERLTISYTNRICIDGKEVTLEELTQKEKEWFGDQIITRPLLSMGYRLEAPAP